MNVARASSFAAKEDDERELIKEEQIKHANLYSLITCVDTDLNSLLFFI